MQTHPRSIHAPIGARGRLAALALFGALVAGGAALALSSPREAESATGDNVIFILTDDQASNELAFMPNVANLIGGQGASFARAYAPYPLCCPSRASLLSGQHMHNHGVRGNIAPAGGWEAFRPKEASVLPVWTQAAGYYNLHIGKYVNGYAAASPAPFPVPPGWDEWYGKVSEAPLYYNYQLIEKTGPGDTPEIGFYGDQTAEYQTDVLRDKAIDFVDGLGAGETPFMMNLWFNAPHGPYDPAARHQGALATSPLPKVQAYDEKDMSDKPKWLRKQSRKRLPKGLKKTINVERRRRLEMLLSVDEAVGALVTKLSTEGILDDTYIVFASDNGFFRGEHRIAGGKFLPHEPSARIPLMIRGPGIPPGGISQELVSTLDITQTVLEIATGSTNAGLDGRSLLPYAQNPALRTTRPILLEADTGGGQGSPGFDPQAASASDAKLAKAKLLGRKGVKDLDQEPMATKSAANGNFAPAYKAIRTERYLFVLYANKQTELYDMYRDPAQLRNKTGDPRYRRVRKFLRRQITAFAACGGPTCRIEIGPDPRPLKRKSRSKPKDKGEPAGKPDKPGK
jgi:N-acetylglucosamine-6-sulfatase